MSSTTQTSPLALITGATRGIGRAISHRFAQAGFDILAVARTKNDLWQLEKDIRSVHAKQAVHIHAADLSSKEQTLHVAKAAIALKQPIAVLVNNAGAFVPDSLLSEEDMLPEQLAINLYSAYYLTRALLPMFMSQKHGHIFNICSVASLQAYPRGASYCISKYALRGFSHVLRQELQTHGVRVSTLLPGAVLTDSWQGTALPKERFIQPEDIADTIYTTYTLSNSAVVEEILIRPQLGDI